MFDWFGCVWLFLFVLWFVVVFDCCLFVCFRLVYVGCDCLFVVVVCVCLCLFVFFASVCVYFRSFVYVACVCLGIFVFVCVVFACLVFVRLHVRALTFLACVFAFVGACLALLLFSMVALCWCLFVLIWFVCCC